MTTKLILFILCFAAGCVSLAGCVAPSDYAFPQAVELNILDSLSVVFVDPGQELTPIRNLMAYADRQGDPRRCYWEVWEPIVVNRISGVWVMSKTPSVVFDCDEASARDSLINAIFLETPIGCNEDIRLFGGR